MIPRLLSSLQHPLVKRLVKLRDDRSLRREENAALIVGEAVVREVAAHRSLKTLISTSPLKLNAEESIVATPEVVKKIVGLDTDDLVAAVVEIPEPADLSEVDTVVILDGISDPGNVGTILRTALALGIDGAFLTPQTADPWNDKALRASRAAPVFLPIHEGEIKPLLQGRNLYIADMKGTDLAKMKFQKPLAIVLGHETKGPSPFFKKQGEAVTIPMKTMESLNVASAAAILIYNIMRKL